MKSGARLLIGALAGATMAVALSGAARADVGTAVRIGTLGIGADVDFPLVDRLNARVGYSGFSYNRTINSADLTYQAQLQISSPYGMLDWFVFGGGFRLSVGAVGTGPKVDATGRSAAGTFSVNGVQYSTSDVSSIAGEFKFGNAVVPYAGVGWGNPVGASHRLTFLFDLGVLYGGKPSVTLSATCAPTAPAAVCAQVATDVAAERMRLQDQMSLLQWYPVISLGLAYRF